jgi:hypothetical protein
MCSEDTFEQLEVILQDAVTIPEVANAVPGKVDQIESMSAFRMVAKCSKKHQIHICSRNSF